MQPEEIKGIREALDLTQEAFAHTVGVAFATVNRWEKGHARPSGLALKALEKMARKAAKVQG
jgi:putative transcriptional regulator